LEEDTSLSIEYLLAIKSSPERGVSFLGGGLILVLWVTEVDIAAQLELIKLASWR
jgi:hypothetical protein